MRLTDYAQNVDAVKLERWGSLIGGGALLSLSLIKRSKATLPLAVLGGGLVAHAVNQMRGNNEMMYASDGKGFPTNVSVQEGHGICVEKSVTIDRSPEELYRWWHNLSNLPTALGYLHSVQVLTDKRSHWVAEAPGGTKVEWDAEIINDIPNELIGWRSLAGADVPNAGSVHFEPAGDGRGTIVKVEREYEPPAGMLGASFAKMFGRDPDQTVYNALLHFKQLMETGQVITTDDQPHGSRNPMTKFME